MTTFTKAPTVGLVEVPTLGLYDPNGKNWTPMFKRNPLLIPSCTQRRNFQDGDGGDGEMGRWGDGENFPIQNSKLPHLRITV